MILVVVFPFFPPAGKTREAINTQANSLTPSFPPFPSLPFPLFPAISSASTAPSLPIRQDFVGKIFKGFLFTMPEQRGRGMRVERPVCADPATRRAALNVLASAARKSPKAMSALLDNVRIYVEKS